MTLRNRLALVTSLLVLAIAGGGFAVWQISRAAHIEQLDQRLETALPALIGFAGRGDRLRPVSSGGAEEAGGAGGIDADQEDNPLSEIYVATIEDDGTRTLRIPSLDTDLTPDIPQGIDVNETRDQPEFTTVESTDGSLRWRATLVSDRESGTTYLAAISQESIEEMGAQILGALLTVGVVVSVVITLAAWWTVRHGLRPISRVAAAANAITSGERDVRVPAGSPGTEAAELATAFNVMLDQRQSAETQLRRFVSDASHELRTPVASIRGFTDLYRNGALVEPAQLDDAMRRIGAEGARMATLVDDLLLLARLDEGRPLSTATLDLSVLLHDAALDASATHPTRVVTVESPDQVLVSGDEHRLRQVFANLVTNALVHGAGNVVLTGTIDSPNSCCTITVRDHGPGLDSDETNQAFDRFWRADSSRQRNGSGSGLGLSIVRAIVEAHGGSATLISQPGEGVTVSVRLPLIH